VRIEDPKCVAKTFPDYFEALFQVAQTDTDRIPVICIDGPTASGKGTVAAAVARALGYHFLDSGALYRITALAATRAGLEISPDNEPRIAELARKQGALTFVDAVHYAPHLPIDVARLGCDFLACSAYKFFGPHLGVLWGRRALLEEIATWHTGTHIEGALDSVDSTGRTPLALVAISGNTEAARLIDPLAQRVCDAKKTKLEQAAALASATLRTTGHLPATTIGHRLATAAQTASSMLPATTIGHRLATAAQTASSVRPATTIGHRQAIDTASSMLPATTIGHRQAIDTASSIWVRRQGGVEASAPGGPSAR
jgi:hypothetical protein